MRPFRVSGCWRVLLGTGVLGAGLMVAQHPDPVGAVSQTQSFSVGVDQEFHVPDGVCVVDVVVTGGDGGGVVGVPLGGGRGAMLSARVPVVPGETLRVDVGARGGDGDDGLSPAVGGRGGSPGGGNAAVASESESALVGPSGGGGGGYSAIRRTGNGAAVLVLAGGGGGAGALKGEQPVPDGGDGGTLMGTPGLDGMGGDPTLVGGGAGGTDTAGGAGGANGDPQVTGESGTALLGGDSLVPTPSPLVYGASGGGGGGGWYGGGGGGSALRSGGSGGGGGGGSSHLDASVTPLLIQLGGRGDGHVDISFDPDDSGCGTLVVTKDAFPSDSQDFSFVLTPSSGPQTAFALDDDDDPALPDSRTFTSVPLGRLTLTEGEEPGWELTELVCVAERGEISGSTAVIDIGVGETVTCRFRNSRSEETAVFAATGRPESYVVPADVCRVHVDVLGAQGGWVTPLQPTDRVIAPRPYYDGVPGLGGQAKGDLAVAPGETLGVLVGVQGGSGSAQAGGAGGFGYGEGGEGGAGQSLRNGGGGGGASAVVRGSLPVFIAGGGGGSAHKAPGGAGGGASGSAAGGSVADGQGGTSDLPGAGGAGSAPGQAGSGPRGGSGGADPRADFGGGGGGGGLFGGGGGAAMVPEGFPSPAGGGGGSGLVPTGGELSTGVRHGDGEVRIAYDAVRDRCPRLSIVKDADPDDGQDFTFSLAAADGSVRTVVLDDDADSVLADRHVFTGLTPGAVTLTEASTSGWTLGSLACDSPEATISGSVASLMLAVGDAIECVFVNTREDQPATTLDPTTSLLGPGTSAPHGSTTSTPPAPSTSPSPSLSPAPGPAPPVSMQPSGSGGTHARVLARTGPTVGRVLLGAVLLVGGGAYVLGTRRRRLP